MCRYSNSSTAVSMAEAEIAVTPSGIACVLLDSGWSWSNELLQKCTTWLQEQGVRQRLDLSGLSMEDLSETEQWSVEAMQCVCVSGDHYIS